MCGIVGIVTPTKPINRTRLEAMSSALAHRGPDGFGHWVSPNNHAGLGHRRLSILDLSPAGAQPMSSPSGRYTLSYNGEIYNFAELRAMLEKEGVNFRGHSDTEVMLAGFEQWGIIDTLTKIDGMFAFGVWDEKEQTLTLVRDRIGIKPLFYSTENNALTFASELRPLVIARGSLPNISAQGLNEYVRLGYVPGPLSIFEGIHKLPAGTYAIFQNGTLSKPNPYWRFTEVARAGRANPFIHENEALEALDIQLKKSVASHMISDVPLGAFLSGGIDSSTVVALMQAQSSRPVKSFSIGFNEEGYNEATHAASVAKHLGTDHTELYITDEDARAVIPSLPEMYDEPFADASQIPTFLVSKLARQQVTVALSGDGGDELFGGYNRYVFVSQFWQRLQKLPLSLRSIAARALAAPSSENWDLLFEWFGPFLPERFKPATPGQKMHKIASILPSASLLSLHSRLVSQWAVPQSALHSAFQTDSVLWEQWLKDTPKMQAPAQQMLWDAQTYMVDDILTKVDRASMQVGLEARVPLLDHHVAELAWRIPLSMKIRGGEGKWLLKQLLYRYVPKALVERPKMGFSVPIDVWLRGPLRDWAESYLSADRLNQEGFFDTHTIRQTWGQHQSGSINRGGMLWTILMFQLWHEKAKTWV